MPRPIKIDAPALRLDPESAFESLDWEEIFGTSGPVEIELGIGVGRFLLAVWNCSIYVLRWDSRAVTPLWIMA